ncbi:hypothetical protein ONZ45_g4685 [Pleurotus djamor]|nr:hypothetical protein ONZ45_g4685 [Pleurotus djamor]
MAVYSRLPSSRSTRILTFAPTPPYARDEAVYCSMSIIPSIDDPEPYYALSYVWGDATTKQHDLICNGRLMKITYNLWMALKAIRAKAPSVRLWVDAICINQEDVPEKNKQVAMMGSIYSGADRVIVWVGEATERTSDFFKAVDIVASGHQLTLNNCPRPGRGSRWGYDDQRSITSYLLDCGDDIAERPWFERVWTFQEIRLAKNAILHCGPYTANMSDVVRTAHQINLCSQGLDVCGARTVDVKMFAPENMFSSLFRLLALTQNRKATDPRDKFFSLLGMLPPHLYQFIKPDYNLTKEQVFAYACRICLELDNDTNILAAAGLDDLPIESRSPRTRPRRSRDLPSWAVDFSVFNDEIYSLQNLSRHLDITDRNELKARYNHGKRLDPHSKTIGITGVAGGRFTVDARDRVIYLSEYPACTLASQSDSETLDLGIRISEDGLFDLWEDLRMHDEGRCDCFAQASTLAYEWSGVPSSIQTGDWLWTTRRMDAVPPPDRSRGEDGRIRVRKGDDPLAASSGYAMYDPEVYDLVDDDEYDAEELERGEEDETPDYWYVIRPVHGEEPCFQLVGKVNNRYAGIGSQRRVVGDTTWSPFMQIQATFTFV